MPDPCELVAGEVPDAPAGEFSPAFFRDGTPEF
jgi:hypothetical protein